MVSLFHLLQSREEQTNFTILKLPKVMNKNSHNGITSIFIKKMNLKIHKNTSIVPSNDDESSSDELDVVQRLFAGF